MEVFNNYAPITLAATCQSTDTSITVTNPSALSTVGNYRLLIDNEIMLATSRSGAVVTVTRGVEGTVAQGHSSGTVVSPIVTAESLNQLRTTTVTVTDWYVDWVGGNDSNDGLSPATAVKTFTGGLFERWGTNAPDLPNGATLHVLSSQPKGAEYFSLYPRVGYGQFSVIGTPNANGATFALGVVTAKNRVTNQVLKAAGFTGKTVGQLVVNQTRSNSVAIITAVVGDVATLSQPIAQMNYLTDGVYALSGFVNVPTRHDDWVVGDTMQVYDLPLVNLVNLSCRGSRNDNAEITKGRTWLEKLYIPDQNSSTGYGIFAPEHIGGYLEMVNCWVDAGIQTQDATFQSLMNGCYLANGFQFQFTNFAATVIGGFGGQFHHINWIEGDSRIEGSSAATGLLYCEDLMVNADLFLHPGAQMEIRSLDYQDALGGTVYGTGSLALQSMSTVTRRSPTPNWTTCLTIANFHFPGSVTTGYALTGDGTYIPNIPVTTKSLDLYHGLADIPTGARFDEDLTVSNPPVDWSSYAFIYIDGTNGDDTNQGFYTTAQGSPAAIKTHAEMFRRLGEEWSPKQDTTVNYIAYPTDPLHLVVHFDATHTISFNAPAFTQNSSGTFSAVTVRNNLTNTPYEVADGTVVTTSDAMRRIRISGGARAGTRAWVAKSTGAGLRRTSEWVTWDPAQIWLTAVTPQVGDPYVVESSSSALKVSHIVVEHSNGYGASYVGPTLVFNDIDFVPPTTGGTTYFENNGCYLNFQDCLFYDGEWQIRTIARSGDNSSAFTTVANCCFGNVGINNILFSQGGATENFVLGGLGFGQIVADAAGGISVAFNYLAQATSSFPNPAAVHGGQLVIDSMGVMDWHGINGGVTLEDALMSLSTAGTNPGAPPTLWGTSSIAGSVGVAINAGGSMRYASNAQITITGASGDFTLGGASVARAWDDTAGAYTPNTACTWTNLVGGSLKDNAHNLMQDAHVYKNTGGAQP